MRAAASLLLLPWMVCSRLLAAGAPGIAVQWKSQNAASENNPSLHYFTGQPITFHVNVSAPLGAHATIIGDLFQATSGDWGAMLFKSRPLSPELTFDQCTALSTTCTLPDLPPVKARTRFLLKMGVRLADEPKVVHPTGTAEIFVYPRQSIVEWKAAFTSLLAHAGMTRVAVFGNGTSLRTYLRRQQIPFDDLGATWPQVLDATSLYLGDSPLRLFAAGSSIPGMHEVLFMASTGDPGILPGIDSVTNGSGGTTVNVTLPGILDHLEDDPRSQEAFMTIIGHAINESYPVNQPSPSTWSQFR